MKKSLKLKLVLSYLIIAIITALTASIVIRLFSGQSLMNLVADQQSSALKEYALNYYAVYGSFEGFSEAYLRSFQPQPNEAPKLPPVDGVLRGVNGLVDENLVVILPVKGYQIGQTLPKEAISKTSLPLEVDGKRIGYIMLDDKLQFQLNAEEERFLSRSSIAIGIAAGIGVVLAVFMGNFLAERLLKPIKHLTLASSTLKHGKLDQHVPVASEDELGELTKTFNQMSADLFQADERRKRLTADITHDLSTPLQIIAGYIEMLENNETTLTPQRINIIKTEINHLRRLVNDLTTLSQVEAGGLEINCQPLNPLEIITPVFQTYLALAQHQGVKLYLQAPKNTPCINADDVRTQQILKNLLDNALRYTPEGGTITLRLTADRMVNISVIDSGCGIDAEDLPYVFDRFYRADRARESAHGKMGLGLSICKALANAQGAEITAASAGRGSGTTISIAFPAITK